MTRTPEDRSKAAPAWRWAARLAAVLLVALRLPHLAGPLDDPHSWRQCDTVHYSVDLARGRSDLLHPAVCWLGAHRTLVLEFPLTEAMAAGLHRTLGESPMWDRLVTFAFFMLATATLHALVRRLAGGGTAWLATLAWLAFPLGQFYSRAPLADFAAVACGLWMLEHAWLALARRSWPRAVLAAAAGALGAAIKAPALVPLAGPLLVVAWAAPVGVRLVFGAAIAVPVAVAFALWRRHVDAVNATQPDWSFLPGFYREVNPLSWYLGAWGERLEPAPWLRVVRRLVREAATVPGAALAALAPWAPVRGHPSPRALAFAWLGCGFLYLAVFFSLNVIHSYYQIPFLPPLALLVALGTRALAGHGPGRGRRWLAGAAYAVFLIACVLAPARLGYYRVDRLREAAADAIEHRVPAGDLVVACDHNSGWSDPRLLQRADRDGFPLAVQDLDPPRLARLASLGARWVAVVQSPGTATEPPAFLEPARVALVPLSDANGSLGHLHLFALGDTTGGRP